ncbi:MAG: hypothetical protein KME15_00030 [Drouetiella hepatica Uher 2000/2452]|jgi:hypothetical protein|uniref:Uncharacterized protein n=1 Tax=Drouetiella hepatica Uher 2000/2452 TaxID=904376 RepID=A0A951ULN8_9CYAN|nr:hypothetical protein [Drouetiella hepatica Uher 2000/2452]
MNAEQENLSTPFPLTDIGWQHQESFFYGVADFLSIFLGRGTLVPP